MTEKLSDTARTTMIEPLLKEGWKMVEGRDAITRDFKFADFTDALGWMVRVGIWAEKWNHHPEWSNVYNKITVTLSTHDADGLSALDAKLARKMDVLAGQ